MIHYPLEKESWIDFQNYALFPHMTVQQNIAYGLEQRNYTKGDIRKEVSKALDMVQLIGFENRNHASSPEGSNKELP